MLRHVSGCQNIIETKREAFICHQRTETRIKAGTVTLREKEKATERVTGIEVSDTYKVGMVN